MIRMKKDEQDNSLALLTKIMDEVNPGKIAGQL